MRILVTGGLAYVGSHTVVALISAGHEVVIVDDLIKTKIEVLFKLQKITGITCPFYKVDVTETTQMDPIINNHQIEGIIHFAGMDGLEETSINHQDYFESKILSTVVLSQLCLKYGVEKFIYSSSAILHGNQTLPLKESMKDKTTTSHQINALCEDILKDTAKKNENFSVALVRYFHPIGAHESGLIGEHSGAISDGLMPTLIKVARKELDKVSIYGGDYDTPDGTLVRDYIHVVDLAKGHVRAIEKLASGSQVYHLDRGIATSDLELIQAFEEENQVKLPYKTLARRPRDISSPCADINKVRHHLDWQAELDLRAMVRDAWNFEKNHF
jgi:UDP-glucose 4-epimerase